MPRIRRIPVKALRSRDIPVAMRSGDTPVPIPNTMVKPGAADGTVLETVRESRRLPDQNKEQRKETGKATFLWAYSSAG